MLTTPVDYAAPAGAEVLGGDWFGDGSHFDSGEELAAALLALAAADRQPRGSRAGSGEGLAPPPPPLPARVAVAISVPPPEPDDARSLELVGEFQVAAMPSFRLKEPGIPAPASQESSGWQPSSATLPASPRPWRSAAWSIRQSVQMLRTTEEILRRLREEAAELAWQMAAEVRREVEG